MEYKETNLSKMSEQNWQITLNGWYRGIDWVVIKQGRKWTVGLPGAPLFKTKIAAYSYITTMILTESRNRAILRDAND